MFSVLVNNICTKLHPFSRFAAKNNVATLINARTCYSQPICSISTNYGETEKSEANIKDVVKAVNNEIKNNPCRTFAVVHVCGKQFKVTPGDSIIIEGYWPPDVGDNIRLDKVLCAGSKNFSLFGTPLVDPGLVDVFATVIEKSLSHTKVHFKKKRRKQYMRINFYRCERTVLRINDVDIKEIQ